MDHTRHTHLSPQEITPIIITDAPIYGTDGSKIGTIAHVHGDGTAIDAVTDVVIDVGGFLGIGTKPVLISINEVDLMRDENGTVHGVTSWTKDQLKNLPEHHD